MKGYIPYIIAGIVGLFICPVSCLIAGMYYYEFDWLEPSMSLLFVVMTWCCRGDDGIFAILRDSLGKESMNDDNNRLDGP